jgi:DNA-3-methyladenine glycosylase II
MPAPKRAPARPSRVQPRAAVRRTDPAAVFEKARRYLMRTDPRLAEVIKQTGRQRPNFADRDPFDALVSAVISQQLSTKAAATIRARVLALVPRLTPEALLAIPVPDLRTAGLSGQKAAYLRDLSERVIDGRLDLAHLETLTDDEVIEAIVAVKGFGRWTAQMFLMFSLHRPDVLPTGDLGIVKGFQNVLGMKSRPSIRTMERAAKVWQPYRSIASWYLWRTLE